MNRLAGAICAVDALDSIALVEVQIGAHRCTATLVGVIDDLRQWPVGLPVTLLFKETEVSLAKNLSGLISMRNRLPAVVTAINQGRLLTDVTLDVDGHVLGSVITTGSALRLGLTLGDQVEALIKANEMHLVRGAAPA
jgi:molybdate transport system regulatory protein